MYFNNKQTDAIAIAIAVATDNGGQATKWPLVNATAAAANHGTGETESD